jgi:hypothetical protein
VRGDVIVEDPAGASLPELPDMSLPDGFGLVVIPLGGLDPVGLLPTPLAGFEELTPGPL